MSSPNMRKTSVSPIRNLDDKSPRRSQRLHTILEEDINLLRPIPVNSYGYQNIASALQNRALNDKIRNYAEETTKFLIENSRLKQENQNLRDLNSTSHIFQVEKLNREIMLKDTELQRLRNDLSLLKAYYDRNLNHSQLQNEGLKNQLIAIQNKRFAEVEAIKEKYSFAAQEDMNLARKGYYEDITRLMTNLEANKALLAQKELQIKHLTNHGQNLVKQHSAYLEQLVSQNNVLRNQILQIQIKKDNEVRNAETKRQLQKSRTHGIISYCKQNAAFMEKQINKLAEELLEKSISIEQFTKDILKVKRNLEQTQKKYEDRIYKIKTDCDEKLMEKDRQMHKAQRNQKQELAEMKRIEMELQEVIATRENQLDSLQRQNQHNKQIIIQKQKEIQELKENVARLHDDHAKQISKVMTQSRVKRKSMKNLSSSSSLKDLSVDGNSTIIKKPLQRQNSMADGSSGQLYTVHEEMVASQLVPNQGQQDQDDIPMKDLVLHYQNMLRQHKSNQALQLAMANEKIQKLNASLRDKQQEVLQILERFSPLMQYRLNESSLEAERKQKIQKHYKANVDLLGVMLQKYGIVALAGKK